MHFAYKKQVEPEWYQIFLKGIGANWLVCLACFLGCSGRDYVSKVVGIWWPTFAFVSLGFGKYCTFVPTLRNKLTVCTRSRCGQHVPDTQRHLPWLTRYHHWHVHRERHRPCAAWKHCGWRLVRRSSLLVSTHPGSRRHPH